MIDSTEMRAGDVEPDHFYYDQALRVMERERGEQPLFMFVYTVANHFPWDKPYRADLTPDGAIPATAVRSTSICAARNERAGLCRLRRAAAAQVFRRILS
jgi:hypothetical protein